MNTFEIYSIYINDPRYPALLKQINDPPQVLYCRGKLFDPKEACIAIVGTRKMSTYGATILPHITKPLIDVGVTIVSGLAYGIDGAAQAEVVKRGCRTIAVLGTGIDDASIYPRAHFRLAQSILENDGLLISEHPPGTPGLKHNFIARNRIIAGLSLGVVVVECKTKSGALLTADYAADFNRNLYAVPGPVYSSVSEGPHHLIRNGAMLTTNGTDILEDLAISLNQLPLKMKQKFTDAEKAVLECIKDRPRNISEIITTTTLPSNKVTEIIIRFELNNIVKEVGSGYFIKI